MNSLIEKARSCWTKKVICYHQLSEQVLLGEAFINLLIWNWLRHRKINSSPEPQIRSKINPSNEEADTFGKHLMVCSVVVRKLQFWEFFLFSLSISPFLIVLQQQQQPKTGLMVQLIHQQNYNFHWTELWSATNADFLNQYVCWDSNDIKYKRTTKRILPKNIYPLKFIILLR